jgi:N utilization substance protein B
VARHKAREQTLQMLFEWDFRRTPLDEIARGYYESLLVSEDSVAKPRPDAFARSLLQGITEELPAIDDLITRHAAHWRLERMPAVDRNVLRVAVYEMMRTDTPPPIVIDEALELARRFAGEESVQFVNGVLDAIRKELPPYSTAGATAPPLPPPPCGFSS